MAGLGKLATAALKRDKGTCQACGVATRPVLAVHHVIPVALGGKDTLRNLTVLCANCHRSVHWLATGERSSSAHGYGLGPTTGARRRLLQLARRIRNRRMRVVGPDLMLSTAVPLSTALQAVVARNGFDRSEARLLKRCFTRAWRAIDPVDRRACSVRLVRGARFLSVNANNHLALRVPAWSDEGYPDDADVLLIWPQDTRPSIMAPAQFRRESAGRFKLIPYFNLGLSWDECLKLGRTDWKVFKEAVHAGLTMARTGRRTSNVVVE